MKNPVLGFIVERKLDLNPLKLLMVQQIWEVGVLVSDGELTVVTSSVLVLNSLFFIHRGKLKQPIENETLHGSSLFTFL